MNVNFINKPGTVELSLTNGEKIKIPLTVITQLKLLTSSKWVIAGNSYDIFAYPTQKRASAN